MPTIIAIETSCDETAVAVLRQEDDQVPTVLAQVVASQINIHKETGGVVPEVAAREHVAVIKPLIEKTVNESGLTSDDLDAIAVTVGPGLMPALSVGVSAAQALSYGWDKPVVPVHHIEGHIYSALLRSAEKPRDARDKKQMTTDEKLPANNSSLSDDTFPVLALIVSGGHTMLIEVTNHVTYRVLGSTRDDAVGEAFDKVARLLDLSYPGGPNLSKLAEEGDDTIYKFARPMIHSGDLDFSFSGLKTEVLYTMQNLDKNHKTLANVAAGFQRAAVDSLLAKTKNAITEHDFKTVLLAGGVAANQTLRRDMQELSEQLNVDLRVAPLELCGDNAVMIGQVGLYALSKGRQTTWDKIDARARWDIETVNP